MDVNENLLISRTLLAQLPMHCGKRQEEHEILMLQVAHEVEPKSVVTGVNTNGEQR